MRTVLLIFCAVGGGVAVASIISCIIIRSVSYADYRTDCRITAKQFFALYSIAPERWSFDENGFCATYQKDVVRKYGDYGNVIQGVVEHVTFKTYRDALRVRRYFRNIEKRKNNAMIMQRRADLLKAWQKDINEFLDKNIIEQGV